jgi:hypothetical protein
MQNRISSAISETFGDLLLFERGLVSYDGIQANLGYYVASELRFVTPGILRGKIRQSGCLYRCGCPPPHWKTFVYFGASSHD